MGRAFRKEISALVKTFPKEETYKLMDQMIRASRSVTANIAEGAGRYHFQENMQFCRHARGSLSEMIDHLTVALDENYIDDTQFTKYRETALLIIKVLNGFIAYLKKQKDQGKDKS